MHSIMIIATSARTWGKGRGILAALGLVGLSFGPVGCGTGSRATQPLSPEAFVASPGEDRGIGNPARQARGSAIRQLPARAARRPPTVEPADRRGKDGSGRGAVTGRGIKIWPWEGAATNPTTSPTTASAEGGTIGSGRYYVIGVVLDEVNGTGIFSDKVINAIEKPLAAEAKLKGPAGFRDAAAQQLYSQIKLYEREELEFASAQKSLDAEDEQLARALTVQWRQKKITEAGGSPELAKRKAAADGWDFDKLVEQQFRLQLIQIFMQKRIFPLIQVAQKDIRAYYEQHKDTEFTTHGQAKFRVIKVDPSQHAGQREEAYAIASNIIKDSATGDFAELAASQNDDPIWKASSGAVGGRDGYVQKGAFRLKEVEEAVWKLRPGQVSGVIPSSSGDGSFYVAKLEALTQDAVQPYESLEVQEKISFHLKSVQFQALREQHDNELRKESIVNINEPMIEQTLETIVAQYPQWAKQ